MQSQKCKAGGREQRQFRKSSQEDFAQRCFVLAKKHFCYTGTKAKAKWMRVLSGKSTVLMATFKNQNAANADQDLWETCKCRNTCLKSLQFKSLVHRWRHQGQGQSSQLQGAGGLTWVLAWDTFISKNANISKYVNICSVGHGACYNWIRKMLIFQCVIMHIFQSLSNLFTNCPFV